MTGVRASNVVCAVGEVHGCLDLLKAATAELCGVARAAELNGRSFFGVFMGDYIGRGPRSRGVIDHLIALDKVLPGRFSFLRGDQEQDLLDILDGLDDGAAWLARGGRATLESYGLASSDEEGPHLSGDLGLRLAAAMPPEHIDFFRRTELYAQSGEYLLVHAGLRPDRALDEQDAEDMLRQCYEDEDEPVHGQTVVHCHAPSSFPVNGVWRIGIDTEAHASGALTLLRLEGGTREFLRVRIPRGAADAQIDLWDRVITTYPRTRRRGELGDQGRTGASAGARGAGHERLLFIATLTFILAAIANIAIWLHTQTPAPTFAVADLAQPAAAPATTPPPPLLRGALSPDPPPALPPPKRSTANGPRVQIGALASPDQASRAYQTLAKSYPEAFESRRPEVEPVRLGPRTLYRAYVAGFENERDAQALCGMLSADGHPCMVRKTG